MSDTATLQDDLEFQIPLVADDDDAGVIDDGSKGTEAFKYIGKGLTASEFVEYVRTYDFGSIPPDYVVLHHTAVPYLANARSLELDANGMEKFPAAKAWDVGGNTDEERFQKRLRNLGSMRDFFRDVKLWTRGPHLFVDEQWIWLFTPMADVGIHAKQGNYIDHNPQNPNWNIPKHYSIGIEVVGDYTTTKWSDEMAKMVGLVVATLQKRLQTFKIEYKPGPRSHLMGIAREHGPIHHVGGICSHRDFNKAACPGNMIPESYYLDVINAAM